MDNSNEVKYINKHFATFFQEYGFELKSSSIAEIIFENSCSQLIFSYDIRYQPIFEELYYKSKASGKKYLIRNLIPYFHKDINFKELLTSYMGKIGDLKMSDIQAYSIIIPQYLGEVIKSCDFSWEEKLV